MRIVRLNKLDSGKSLAYVDIETDEGIIIKGFRLVNGQNGIFLASPDERGKDGNYYETVIVPKHIKSQMEKLAIEEYNKLK